MPTSEDRTEPDKSGHIVNPQQSQAIEMLLSGMNDRRVAAAISVRRQTVCDWSHRPEFSSPARRPPPRDVGTERRAPAVAISPAVESIEWRMLGSRDLKLAFQLIEIVGLGEACRANLGLPPPPIHDPVATSPEFAKDRAERQAIADGYMSDAFAAPACTGPDDDKY